MKLLLPFYFLLFSSLTIAQNQTWKMPEKAWKSAENGHIPDGLKQPNAKLVCIVFSDEDIKELGLHEPYTTGYYNKLIVKYAEKYFAGKKEYISWSEFHELKDDIDYAFMPMIYEPGRAEGIAPRTFCVVDVPNEIAYTRIDRTGDYITAGSMKSEMLLEMKFIAKQRNQ